MSITITSITLSGERPFGSRLFRLGFGRSTEIVEASTRLARGAGPALLISDDPLERRALELAAKVANASIEVASPASLEAKISAYAFVGLVLPSPDAEVIFGDAIAIVGPALRAVHDGGVVVDFYDLHAESWWRYRARSDAFRAALEGER